MIDQCNHNRELRDVLERLETNLLVPIVAGELPSWINEVCSAWKEAAHTITMHVCGRLPLQYDEIANQDSDLLRRVEELKADNEAILKEMDCLQPIVTWLAEHASDFEPDELKLKHHVALLTKDCIAFLQHVKKHELAVQTWFVEAFNRDRGVGD
jgi:hypothetical protein